MFEKYLTVCNIIIAALLTVAYFYQLVYLIIGIIKKPKKFKSTDQSKKYAVLVSARNECNVIGNLIASIKAQSYPADKITVFVVADNCTDNTAETSKNLGAVVYERFNAKKIGKGYALEFLLDNIDKDFGISSFDAYIVLDADNLILQNYITEMDKAFCSGYEILTSYRNSKNFSKNWITAGYGIWFLREARYLNNPRCLCNTSCAISGTGFLVSSEVIKENNGWKHFLLTEDIEFTVDSILHGRKIGYCHEAMFYDEQPVSFGQSWKQRLRWSKGFFQICGKYGGKLVKGALTAKFACFDMLMNIAPAFFLTSIQMILSVIGYIGVIVTTGSLPFLTFLNGLLFLGYAYLFLFLYGLAVVVFERKKIICPTFKLIVYTFLFPLFMFTYFPISWTAVFKKVKWDPIAHTDSRAVEELEPNVSK